MSVRAALEGKQARRAVVPIPLSDPGPARQAVAQAEQLAGAAREQVEALGDDVADAVLAGAQAQLEEARAALAAVMVEVTLVAPPHDKAEAIAERYVRADGGTDYVKALPLYLALCCEDEELRDATWWAEQLARPEWGTADIQSLLLAVMYLVADVVRPELPKG